MSQALQVIEKKLNSDDVRNKLAVALNLDPADEKSIRQASRYVAGVLDEIRKTAGDSKRDLTVCNPDSIVQCMIDAARFKIDIDGKQHAHLVKFGSSAQLQIGYRGYIAKISENYKNADFTAEAIFKGDEVSVSDIEGFQSYSMKRNNPFADSWLDLIGVIVRLSYTKGAQQFQKITTVSKSDLEKMRKAAKQDFIWAQWPIEKAKAAAIKRACKIQFADVTGLQEMIRYDNEANFNVDQQPASPVRRSIVDNINKNIALPPERPTIEHDDDGVVIEQETDNSELLIETAREMAEKGRDDYSGWLKSLSDNEKRIIQPHHPDLSRRANTVTREKMEAELDQPLI